MKISILCTVFSKVVKQSDFVLSEVFRSCSELILSKITTKKIVLLDSICDVTGFFDTTTFNVTIFGITTFNLTESDVTIFAVTIFNLTIFDETIFLTETRFPRREDYEEVQVVQLDETYEEKLVRLLETIESSQGIIKEVVDKDTLGLEEKIFRILDLKQVQAFAQNCFI